VMKIYDEENVALDSEMTEVISKEAVIQAWRQLRHDVLSSSAWKGEAWSRGTHPIVIYKNITCPIVAYKKIGVDA
jgi:hypothetical protein